MWRKGYLVLSLTGAMLFCATTVTMPASAAEPEGAAMPPVTQPSSEASAAAKLAISDNAPDQQGQAETPAPPGQSTSSEPGQKPRGARPRPRNGQGFFGIPLLGAVLIGGAAAALSAEDSNPASP